MTRKRYYITIRLILSSFREGVHRATRATPTQLSAWELGTVCVMVVTVMMCFCFFQPNVYIDKESSADFINRTFNVVPSVEVSK